MTNFEKIFQKSTIEEAVRDYTYILSAISSTSKHKRLQFLRPYASMDMNSAYQHGYSDAIKLVMDTIIEEMLKCTGAEILNKDPTHVTLYNSEDSNK